MRLQELHHNIPHPTYRGTHAYSAELWGLRHFSRIQLQRLGTRWHMMKWSNSESDSRNIREADIASSKDTPEPARKTLVA